MTVRRNSLCCVAIAVALVTVGCGNVRSETTTDFRLVRSYLRDVDDPDLRIASETRAEGFSAGHLRVDANPDKTCGVEDFSFHLPAGFERTHPNISVGCPDSLNGPGSYRGTYLGKNCSLSNSVIQIEDGGWWMSVSALCGDE